ncbi:ABC transporter permease [Moraxella sp.]|uniref:ABC transporter permease n=1 Tax=Moraxella sp. TaxID=479 RepID=UPI0026DAA1E7|nr:iron chelate uptake ABC transporter family permease subunit [Moraxella sp.]MDO4894688.1 iron chelate uptake ABC transporter family permease subunit [Moraxella sp.]
MALSQHHFQAIKLNLASILLLIVLAMASVSVGVADFSWQGLLGQSGQDWQLLLVSRLPRTLAIILTGASMAVAGMMMQVVLKNRFVEPSMVGATQSAALGMLMTVLLYPAASVMMKIVIATICAMIGMMVFMRLIRRLPATDYLIVPLVGIVYGGIIDAFSTFIAYQTEMVQLLGVWRFGDFSSILAGRYEMLWLVGILAVVAYVLADRLTIVGLGDHIAKNLGVNKELVMWLSVAMVALISSVVVSTVGMIPFVGLIVPNIISRVMGDRLRLTLPAVALFGSSAVLICDIIGRVIRYPFEIPVTVVFGVLGALVFLVLLFHNSRQAG